MPRILSRKPKGASRKQKPQAREKMRACGFSLAACGLAYWHFGSPSLVAGEFDVEQIGRASCRERLAFVMFVFHSSHEVASPDNVFPGVSQHVAEPRTGVPV